MKKITFILIALIGLTAFAQKAEVKSAEKALKKQDFATATEMINKACQLKDQADDKTKAKIMYVKAKIFAAKGGLKNNETALKTIEKLKAFEKQVGKKRYSDDADELLQKISLNVEKIVVDKRNKIAKMVESGIQPDDPQLIKVYTDLSKSSNLMYQLTGDKQYKYMASIANILSGEMETAEKQLQELYDSGYTGVKEIYTLKEKESGQRVQVKNETEGKILLGTGKYEDLKKEKTPSVRPDIIANLLYVYGQNGKDDKVIELIQKAKAEDPNNLDLVLGEANYYQKKGDNVKYAEAMKRAVELKPDDKVFNFNLGIAYRDIKKYDESKKAFEKAIEIDPDFYNAYVALAEVILMPDKEITEKMNQNEVLANDALYEKYNNQRKELYKKALPVLEKAYSLNPNDENLLITLKNIYSVLEMDDKFNEVKDKLRALKGR